MGLPAMIGMMVNALYNLADAYFVGGLGTSQVGCDYCHFSTWAGDCGIGPVIRKRCCVLHLPIIRTRAKRLTPTESQAQPCTAA